MPFGVSLARAPLFERNRAGFPDRNAVRTRTSFKKRNAVCCMVKRHSG
jgi:hypothetical protein